MTAMMTRKRWPLSRAAESRRELAHEADERRDAGQREHADDQRQGEQGRAAVQAGQVVDGDVGAVARDLADHHEAGQHHQQVADDVVEGGGVAELVEGDEADQGVAGVGDAGEAQQALEVLLHQGDEVAVEHGAGREDGQHDGDGVIVRRGQRNEADQDGDRADLRQRGDEAGGFVGGALIDVGRPEVEGEDRQLVVEAAEGQREAGDGQGRMDHRLEPGQQIGQGGRAGQAEEVAHAEEHHAVGGDAEHDVFDRGLHLALLALALAAHGHHEVERERPRLRGRRPG